ncbi:MAG: hypothetical protein AB7H97_10055 [Pseudobdellovibrionaceae bacterium]
MKLLISLACVLFSFEMARAQQEISQAQLAQLLKAAGARSPWRINLGVGLSGFKEMKVSAMRTKTADSKSEGKMNQDLMESVNLSVNSAYLPENSFGFIGGVTYDTDSRFGRGAMQSKGETSKIEGADDRLSTLSLSANLVYRGSALYVPVGANLTTYFYTPDPDDEARYKYNGGVGAQAGLGFFAGPTASIEFWYRAQAFSMSKETDKEGVYFDRAQVTSASMMAKYWF